MDYLESMILLKIFSNESMAWREIHEMWTWPWVILSKSSQDHYCFFKWKYFLLHILEPYLESFPKHYNKVTFYWVLSELWSLKFIPPAFYPCTHAHMSGILTRVRTVIYSHCLTYAHAHGIESNPSQLNDSTFRLFHIALSFNFITLVSFFKVIFKMAAYSSNVDIILVCLMKLDEIIVEQKDCIVIDIRLHDIQMQCR